MNNITYAQTTINVLIALLDEPRDLDFTISEAREIIEDENQTVFGTLSQLGKKLGWEFNFDGPKEHNAQFESKLSELYYVNKGMLPDFWGNIENSGLCYLLAWAHVVLRHAIAEELGGNIRYDTAA